MVLSQCLYSLCLEEANSFKKSTLRQSEPMLNAVHFLCGVSSVRKLYQLEINKLTAYMKDKGFELSREKTCLMLFNNGENPKSLPQIELDGQLLNYKQNLKKMGVYMTTKLNWRLHIENVINKARKRLNFLKNS